MAKQHIRKGAAAKLRRQDVAKLHRSAVALVEVEDQPVSYTGVEGKPKPRKRTKKVVKNDGS